jgi:hypothetical protein
MNAAIGKIRSEKDFDKKRELVAQFKKDFAADLDKMIDPDHPDFGPKNNQILYFWGAKRADVPTLCIVCSAPGLAPPTATDIPPSARVRCTSRANP